VSEDVAPDFGPPSYTHHTHRQNATTTSHASGEWAEGIGVRQKCQRTVPVSSFPPTTWQHIILLPDRSTHQIFPLTTNQPTHRCFRNNLTCVQLVARPPEKRRPRQPPPSPPPTAAESMLPLAAMQQQQQRERKGQPLPGAEQEEGGELVGRKEQEEEDGDGGGGGRSKEPLQVDERPLVELALSRTDPGGACVAYVCTYVVDGCGLDGWVVEWVAG
jgi:hypothetical protein